MTTTATGFPSWRFVVFAAFLRLAALRGGFCLRPRRGRRGRSSVAVVAVVRLSRSFVCRGRSCCDLACCVVRQPRTVYSHPPIIVLIRLLGFMLRYVVLHDFKSYRSNHTTRTTNETRFANWILVTYAAFLGLTGLRGGFCLRPRRGRRGRSSVAVVAVVRLSRSFVCRGRSCCVLAHHVFRPPRPTLARPPLIGWVSIFPVRARGERSLRGVFIRPPRPTLGDYATKR